MKRNIKELIKAGWTDITTHWKTPHEGEYVNYREFANFCIGGAGAASLTGVLGYLSFAASCFLVGSLYGIAFKHIYFISLLGLPFSYLFNVINMLVTDNLGDLPAKTKKVVNAILLPVTLLGLALYFVPQQFTERFLPALPQVLANILITSVVGIYYRIFVMKKLSPKFGKFRPWIIVSIVPMLVSFMLLVYLPFPDMVYFKRLWTLHLMFSIYNMFSSFPSQLYNIQNVISPVSDERVKIMSIGSVIYSSVPSVVGLLLPICVSLVGGFNSLKTFRIVLPIFTLVLSLMSLALFFGVKERVVVAKSHKPKINFWQGSKSVLKNKYFWITNISGLFGGITTGAIILAQVLFVYGVRQDWLLGVFSTITGPAYVPGMLLATFFIRKFGKRNLVLFAKFASILTGLGQFWAIMISSVPLFIVFAFLNILLITPSTIATQAMTADIWDYQQWLTGERLDGFSGIFGLFTTPINTAFGLVIPAVYAIAGFTSDWDILYVKDIRDKVIIYSILVSVLSTALTAVPYFFYDLSEKKHKAIIETLKERAAAEDIENDEMSLVAATAAAGNAPSNPTDAEVSADTDGAQSVETEALDDDSSDDPPPLI